MLGWNWARTMTLAALVAVGPVPAGLKAEAEHPAAPAVPEVAVRDVWLRAGFAEVLRFERSVGTVIVGDAAVLDATALDDTTVVLTALEAGRTNVTVLGQEGNVLARLGVRVRAPEPPTARVFRGTGRSVLVCDPACVPVEGESAAPANPEE